MDLRGKTILVTRAPAQSEELREGLEALGAEVLITPVIQVVPIEDWDAVDRAVRDLDAYDWLLFTSANAVDAFMKRVQRLGARCEVSIAVVGTATSQRLHRWNLAASLVPDTFRAEGLLSAFPSQLTGKRILFPRAETARELLPEELRKRGALVDVVTVYRTVGSAEGLAALRSALLKKTAACVVFTSPSAIRFLVEAAGDELHRMLEGVAVAVIGPVAGEAAKAVGIKPAIEPERATAADLVEAIRKYFESGQDLP